MAFIDDASGVALLVASGGVRRVKRALLLITASLVLALTGCAADDQAEPGLAQSPTTIASEVPTATGTGTTETGQRMDDSGTHITLTIGDQVVDAMLFDNPAANELAARLPLTMTFDDFNGVEKIAALDAPLSMDGMPEGADPEIGDIGFWAPGGDLVLYYGDVGYWNGIARLGTFDGADAVRSQSGPFTITVAIA